MAKSSHLPWSLCSQRNVPKNSLGNWSMTAFLWIPSMQIEPNSRETTQYLGASHGATCCWATKDALEGLRSFTTTMLTNHIFEWCHIFLTIFWIFKVFLWPLPNACLIFCCVCAQDRYDANWHADFHRQFLLMFTNSSVAVGFAAPVQGEGFPRGKAMGAGMCPGSWRNDIDQVPSDSNSLAAPLFECTMFTLINPFIIIWWFIWCTVWYYLIVSHGSSKGSPKSNWNFFHRWEEVMDMDSWERFGFLWQMWSDRYKTCQVGKIGGTDLMARGVDFKGATAVFFDRCSRHSNHSYTRDERLR